MAPTQLSRPRRARWGFLRTGRFWFLTLFWTVGMVAAEAYEATGGAWFSLSFGVAFAALFLFMLPFRHALRLGDDPLPGADDLSGSTA